MSNLRKLNKIYFTILLLAITQTANSKSICMTDYTKKQEHCFQSSAEIAALPANELKNYLMPMPNLYAIYDELLLQGKTPIIAFITCLSSLDKSSKLVYARKGKTEHEMY